MRKHKKPWLSALLNVLLPGVGYIYNGKRNIFGVLLLISTLGGFYVGDSELERMFTGVEPVTILLLAVIALVWAVAFALDAYQEAKEINSEIQK